MRVRARGASACSSCPAPPRCGRCCWAVGCAAATNRPSNAIRTGAAKDGRERREGLSLNPKPSQARHLVSCRFVMILPLRIRHRRVFTVLGVVLPVTFGLGIAARKPVPANERAAGGNFRPARPGSIRRYGRDAIFSRMHRLKCVCSGQRTLRHRLAPPPLISWGPTCWCIGAEAKFTAAICCRRMQSCWALFSATALPLPADAAKRRACFVLFSLADQEVVAVLLVPFNSSTL